MHEKRETFRCGTFPVYGVPREQVYIMIYPIAMVTRCAGQYKIHAQEDLSYIYIYI